MVSEIDIYRTAKVLIDKYGVDAEIFARVRADELLIEGDLDGQRVWMRIIEAVEELQTSPPGKVIH